MTEVVEVVGFFGTTEMEASFPTFCKTWVTRDTCNLQWPAVVTRTPAASQQTSWLPTLAGKCLVYVHDGKVTPLGFYKHSYAYLGGGSKYF